MDSIEVTKVSTAVLVAGIAYFVAGWIGASIVRPELPAKPVIEIKGAPSEAAATPAPEAQLAPIGPLLAAADPAAGEATFKKLCSVCHTANEGGKAGVGPNLYGVVGGPHAHMEGFNYTAGMKAKSGPWTFDELNEWLHKPSSYVPGTRMTFAGISNDKERANVIAYLRSLSPNPVPLPPATPAAAPAPAAGTAPAPAGGGGTRASEGSSIHASHWVGSGTGKRIGVAGRAGARCPGAGSRDEVIPDIDALIAAACAAADVAGAVIRPFFRAGIATVQKADRSPVTIADRTAEQAMRAVLTERFPDHGVLGEEFGLDRPDAPLRWVLDPIDGTRAFISGRPTFGTLIALFQDGRPVVGIIDQPVTGERWIGASGRATAFRGPYGGVAGCRPCPILADAELSCTSPEMLGADMPRWERLRRAVRRNYWGGDCYAHGLVALGQIDIVAENDMNVWDWGPLVPVIEGAGGSVTDWRGQKLRPDGDRTVLSVGDKTLLPAILRELNDTLAGT